MAIDAKTESDLRRLLEDFVGVWGPVVDEADGCRWDFASIYGVDEMAYTITDFVNNARDLLGRMGNADAD